MESTLGRDRPRGRPERAIPAISAAQRWLHEIAEKIDDPAARRGYLEDVAENAAIIELATALTAG